MSNLKVVSPIETIELDQAVLTYQELQSKIKYLTSLLDVPKAIIEAAASQTVDGKIITENYKISLTVSQRENFSLKNAKAVLGEEVLAPFTSVSVYTQLRVS